MKRRKTKSGRSPAASNRTAGLTATIAICLCHHAAAQQTVLSELPPPAGSPGAAAATPGHVTLSAGVEHTDNVTRIPDNGIADTIYNIGTDFRWGTRAGGRTDANIDGDLSYYKYTKADYQPEIVGTALGNLSYAVVPDFFYWQIQDSFRQVRINEVEPVTADNRQDTNLFSTGPRLQFPLGNRRTLLTVDGQYERSSYSVSAQESEVLLGRLAILRRIGASSTISLSGTGRQVNYDDQAAFPDYDAQEYLLNWTAIGSRTTIELDVGYSYTQQEDRDDDSPYFRLSLLRNLTPRTSVSLYGSHQLTGSSDAIHFGQTGGGSGPRTSDFSVNPDPFTLEQVGLIYNFASTRSSINLEVSMQQDRYQVSTIDDRDAVHANLQAWTMLGPIWTVGAFGGYSREKYIERNDIQSTFIDYGVFAGARIASRVRLELSASHRSRETDFGGSEYEENTVRATLSYTWGQSGYSSGIGMPRSTR